MFNKSLTHTPFAIAVLFLLSLAFTSCDKEHEFAFELDDLLDTPWGIPQVVEPGMGDMNLDAPTIFYADGHMQIGPGRYDFWSMRDSRSLLVEQAQEIWFIIDLTSQRLYVEKTRQTDGMFLGKFMYYPMDE